MFLVFEKMAFEPFVGTYLNYGKNTYDRQSTCHQTLLTFHISLREMVSNLISLGLMEN